MRVVFDLLSGEITAVISPAAGAPEGFDTAEVANVGMTADQTHYMLPDGTDWTLTPRPGIIPWPATMTSPATLDMAALPTGATVTATNEAGETVTTSDPLDPVELTGAGETYSVTVTAPFPWIPFSQTIEVT